MFYGAAVRARAPRAAPLEFSLCPDRRTHLAVDAFTHSNVGATATRDLGKPALAETC